MRKRTWTVLLCNGDRTLGDRYAEVFCIHYEPRTSSIGNGPRWLSEMLEIDNIFQLNSLRNWTGNRGDYIAG
jgi:hypothetical protein